MLQPGDTTVTPLNGKLRLSSSHFGLLVPLNQQAKKGVSELAGVIDSGFQVEIGLLLHNEGTQEYVWNIGDPFKCLLVLVCPVT